MAKEMYTIKRRRIWLSLILCVVTVGIFQWIWFYNILKDSDRITVKRRNVLPLYWVTVCLMFLAVASSVVSFAIFIIYGKFPENLTINNIFDSYVEMPITQAVWVYIFLILGALLALVEFVLIYILIFKLTRNLEEQWIYYYVPLFLFGLLIPLIYAQSMINNYSGIYKIDERPAYLGGIIA